jgi:hypothetical protein
MKEKKVAELIEEVSSAYREQMLGAAQEMKSIVYQMTTLVEKDNGNRVSLVPTTL